MSERYGIGHALAKQRAAQDAAAEAEMNKEAEQPATMAAVLAQMAALMEKIQADKGANVEQNTATLGLIERLITKTHPENVEAPGHSVYSYPEGDQARPKPSLRYKTFWCGYEVNVDTLRPDEIDLLNRVMPGEYSVTKADGIKIPFRVRAKESDRLGPDGKPAIEELSIWFPSKGDNKQNHMSMTSYLQQVLGEKLPSVPEMLAEVQRLKAELESARAGVVGRV